MNEHSEKETVSCAREHSKAKVTCQSLANIPNDSHLLVVIRCFTKTGVLWLWAYYDVYWGCTTGMGTGVPLRQKGVYVRASNENFIVTCTIYCLCVNLLNRLLKSLSNVVTLLMFKWCPSLWLGLMWLNIACEWFVVWHACFVSFSVSLTVVEYCYWHVDRTYRVTHH